MAKKTTPAELLTHEEINKRLGLAISEMLTIIGDRNYYYGHTITESETGKKLCNESRENTVLIVREAVTQLNLSGAKLKELKQGSEHSPYSKLQIRHSITVELVKTLLKRTLPLQESDLIELFSWSLKDPGGMSTYSLPIGGLVTNARAFQESHGLSKQLKSVIATIILALRNSDYHSKDARKYADQFQTLIDGKATISIEPGEAWSDAAIADLTNAGDAWNELLVHCQSGGKGNYTEKWRKAAESFLKSVGFPSFKVHVLKWFPLVDKPRTQPKLRDNHPVAYFDDIIIDPHVELLRGLVWCCGFKEDADLARAVAKLAVSAYRKIPGKGPRLISLGNACVTALGMMPGLPSVGQLAVLKVKVKFGSAQKEIEKAFNAAATREGLPRDEIEELAVPSYGLEEVGVLKEQFGEYSAELLVDGSSASLFWSKGGKPIKSVPAAVKTEHAEAFKELQGSLKDINAMLPAQRERIDTLYLLQKSWPLATWKERYLEHPLIGTIARRLIWEFETKDKKQAGIWHDGKLVDANDKPLSLPEKATVSLWHPIDRPTDDVVAWRNWLEKHEVCQPFKQAHREVYVLTDAERRTGTYSNRFAAHVLRQHQYNALAIGRGWKNKLRLMVDDSYPPTHKLLPLWNLRAEYWVEGAGTEYGSDTNETGTYHYLTTDQVRFYPIDAAHVYAHAGGGGYGGATADEALPLDRIPPLILSEVLRDVDLFVGVASVGNNPEWNDGGPGGAHQNYWHQYSFGELGVTAQTRKGILERLIPRLKIADRCTIADRFLEVKGDLREYKIHLGSGNILMKPNDQYLCIVPKQTVSAKGAEKVFLPFEGDNTMSIILSKAFLLAADKNITDSTITSQIARK